jgi:tetratricopeptide (TPR) repeat protein
MTSNRIFRTPTQQFATLIFAAGFVLSAGCNAPSPSPGRVDSYIEQYEASYRAAVRALEQSIARGVDSDNQRLKLGLLYFKRGDFDRAIETLRLSGHADARKYLAQALYRAQDFTEAYKSFQDLPDPDDESRYYLGMTCERLNLFDQALKTYRAIRDPAYRNKALDRINTIERTASSARIQEIDAAVAALITSAPSQADYPQAGALILLSEETTEITVDNRELTRLHYIIKILNERGKEKFAEMPTSYDSTYEKVTLEYARTVTPDGRVLEVGSRHIRDMSKYMNFPLYSNARVQIISFPELVEGSTIEYAVRIERNQLINKEDFVSGNSLQTSEPVVSPTYDLVVPAGRKIFLKPINQVYNDFGAQISPRIENAAGKTSYRWRFKNIPQIIPEPNMPASTEINPAFIFSTFKDWRQVYEWWWSLAQDKIKADGSIKARVKELTKAAASEEEKARAIYHFCAREIRYVAVEYGQAGYEPHQAADIFQNKYGDCKDQAILLVTMLREAGLAAWPVLIGTKDGYNLDPDFPAMLFNHAIAVVSLNDRLFFLDPTAETCSFGDLPSGDQDRTVMVIRPDGYSIERTPLFTAAHNRVRQETDITLSADESIKAHKRIQSFGVYDQFQRYWLLYTVPELVKDHLAAKAQEASIGAQLQTYAADNVNDLNKPVALRYSFSGPEYLTAAGALRIMPQLANVDTGLVSKEKRRYPIEFDFLDMRQALVTFHLPAGFVIQHKPADITQDSPWLSFTASYRQQGRQLVFSQEVITKKPVVPVEEYPQFKAFMEGLAKMVKQRVVLEKKK